MKKKLKELFFSILIVLLFNACSDPVFHYISHEPPKKLPLINGAPTNLAKDTNGYIYTASGSNLYKYTDAAVTSNPWSNASITIQSSNINRPWIRQLVITNKFIYAVCDDRKNNIFIARADLTAAGAGQITNLVWSSVTGTTNAESIFAAGTNLYFSVRKPDKFEYSIYHLDDSASTPVLLLDEASYFAGAEFDGTTYYLCTRNGYYFSGVPNGFTADYFCELPSKDFMGIINLGAGGGNKIAAITRGGILYDIKVTARKELDETDEIAGFPDDRRATGALAVWSEGTNYLLLAGRQDISYSTNTGYTYGYVEIGFNSSGLLPEENKKFRIPGTDDKPAAAATTVFERSRYVNSIGKNPVNSIIQAPDTNKTLFASTQKNGVWSYRDIGNGLQWNAEE